MLRMAQVHVIRDKVLREGASQRRVVPMRRGLIPFWAKDAKAGYRMINAVGETAAVKPAFRSAFKARRCLILADGFYEWRKEGKAGIPNYIFLKTREPFAFAGMWETWKSPEGESVVSCTIVTTTPNEFIAPIHNRMPVILSQETESLWLDPVTQDPAVLMALLVPSPPELLDSSEVSTLVNSPKNSGPECIQPAPETHSPGRFADWGIPVWCSGRRVTTSSVSKTTW